MWDPRQRHHCPYGRPSPQFRHTVGGCMSYNIFPGVGSYKNILLTACFEILFDNNIKQTKNIGVWLLSPYQGGVNWTRFEMRS